MNLFYCPTIWTFSIVDNCIFESLSFFLIVIKENEWGAIDAIFRLKTSVIVMQQNLTMTEVFSWNIASIASHSFSLITIRKKLKLSTIQLCPTTYWRSSQFPMNSGFSLMPDGFLQVLLCVSENKLGEKLNNTLYNIAVFYQNTVRSRVLSRG